MGGAGGFSFLIKEKGEKGGGEEIRYVRPGVDEADADDILDEVFIVKGAHLAEDEADGEERGAEDVEASQPPALVMASLELVARQCWDLRGHRRHVHALVDVVEPRGAKGGGEEYGGAFVRGVEVDAARD